MEVKNIKKMGYERIIYFLFFILLTSFCTKICTKNKKLDLSKNDYLIIGTAINGLLDSLDFCDKRKMIVIADSTSLKPVLLSMSVKELLKHLPDTNSVMNFKLLELERSMTKQLVKNKLKLKGFKSVLKRHTIIFEQRNDEYFWENVMKSFPNFCCYTSFTKPVIKDNLAALYIEKNSGYGAGAGYNLLLKRKKNEWRVVYINRVWIE